MTKTLFIAIALSLCTAMQIYAQSPTTDGKPTKWELLNKKNDAMLHWKQINIREVAMADKEVLKAKLRVVIGEDKNTYFLLLENGGYGAVKPAYRVALVEYSDLVKLNQAVKRMQKEVEEDLKDPGHYTENRYLTEDGFRVGYFINEAKKAQWFVRFDYRTTQVAVDADELIKLFSETQTMLEDMKGRFNR